MKEVISIIPLDAVSISMATYSVLVVELRYHMYSILEDMELKHARDFEYGKGLSIPAKCDAGVGGEDSTVGVEQNRIDIKIDDGLHVQACVIPNDN